MCKDNFWQALSIYDFCHLCAGNAGIIITFTGNYVLSRQLISFAS